MHKYQWWACIRVGERFASFGPYETREIAHEEGAKHAAPGVRTISTGYGSAGPHFDIRWERLATKGDCGE